MICLQCVCAALAHQHSPDFVTAFIKKTTQNTNANTLQHYFQAYWQAFISYFRLVSKAVIC